MSESNPNGSGNPLGPEVDVPMRGVLASIRDFFSAFADLLRCPRAFWIINGAFMLDSMAYFGMLTLMTAYLHQDVGLADRWSHLCVSFFTGCVTLFMLGIGGLAERLGVRRGLTLAILVCLLGRIIYSWTPLQFTGGALVVAVLAGLFVIALGEGIVQPMAYAGIKQYTDDKSAAMGYGLIYALMNLGIFVIGLISPLIRVPIDKLHQAAEATASSPSPWNSFAHWVKSGMMGVNWVCVMITAAALVFYMTLMTRKAESGVVRDLSERALPEPGAALPWLTRLWRYFSDGPFGNPRFVFFIFMLLPVQTLFAHQWLTVPQYVLRAYSQGVADRMEWIVNWINPGIIFFGVPIATALTRRANVYTMMIIGSAVSALPTFLLCAGPQLPALLSYLVLFSIGEALWQPRFLQYAAELAPEGKVAQYMGLANVPWITAKMTTGLYSGSVLAKYCPEQGPQHTTTMWLIYGIIAITSPIGLLLARKWVMSGIEKVSGPRTGFPVEEVSPAS